MKRFLSYLLVAGLLVLAGVLINFYQQYMGEDADPATENSNPLIRQRLNAIVTHMSAGRPGGHQPQFTIDYTDIDTKAASSFVVNDRYRHSLSIGDTVTKEKGEKLLLIYKKEGKIETVPID